ncbi:hypothetical protein I7636_02375 [Mycoplasma mycoides subsp. capri]|uniref:hypothetical protein n=1 Tax=Mycoplasma mycoides TaxID=2102 RepID=UPI00223EA698|nr:hypothetical protein [Mycoplasma mycoides]QVK01580.1 hypothetical protein I7636_02375 [Mycoplasma mycoides subsp. capri]
MKKIERKKRIWGWSFFIFSILTVILTVIFVPIILTVGKSSETFWILKIILLILMNLTVILMGIYSYWALLAKHH